MHFHEKKEIYPSGISKYNLVILIQIFETHTNIYKLTLLHHLGAVDRLGVSI